jgi:hypothetical protein
MPDRRLLARDIPGYVAQLEAEVSTLTARVDGLEFVLASIARGVPFRGESDPREIARRLLERDW